MLISTFDVASQVGAAHGETDDAKPILWSWCLSDQGEERHHRLAHFDRFLLAYFSEFSPGIVAYELPLGIATIARMMSKGIYTTNEDALLLLRGGIGVLEARASAAGVPRIIGVDIKDARKHLTGQRTFPAGSGAAKAATMRAARALGWDPKNLDEADASAIWALICAQENPAKAAMMTRAHLAAKDMTIGRKSDRVARESAGPLFRRR